jgi:nucleotide-binding universal stress UspA family protein
MNYEIKKILVAVDLSDASLNALEAAAEIAKTKNASLHVIHIQDTGLAFYPENEMSSLLPKNSNNILTALVSSIRRTHGFEPEILIDRGIASNLIVQHAFTGQFDLIILGTHGESGYRNCFIGSTAYMVVKSSSCPVLLIPPVKKVSRFTKVLFPIRPVTNAMASYNILCHFLSAGARLEVMGLAYKVHEKTNLLDSLVNDVHEQLKADKISVHTSWLLGTSIAENISSMVSQIKSDLLVITSALDITTKPFFVGPHTQHILNVVRIPVLCIKKTGSASFA